MKKEENIMGSLSLCYKKLLRSYIEWNSYLSKY